MPTKFTADERYRVTKWKKQHKWKELLHYFMIAKILQVTTKKETFFVVSAARHFILVKWLLHMKRHSELNLPFLQQICETNLKHMRWRSEISEYAGTTASETLLLHCFPESHLEYVTTLVCFYI